MPLCRITKFALATSWFFGANLALTFSAVAAPPRDVPIQILSATTKDKVVDGAEVILQKDGQSSVAGVTDAQGC
jgi:hypothetical protein